VMPSNCCSLLPWWLLICRLSRHERGPAPTDSIEASHSKSHLFCGRSGGRDSPEWYGDQVHIEVRTQIVESMTVDTIKLEGHHWDQRWTDIPVYLGFSRPSNPWFASHDRRRGLGKPQAERYVGTVPDVVPEHFTTVGVCLSLSRPPDPRDEVLVPKYNRFWRVRFSGAFASRISPAPI
jgi:hypothetical protein